MTPDPHDESERSKREMAALGPKLAEQAAAVLRHDPDADPVGLVAEAGTLEAKRIRTKFEQRTGIELEGGAVAVVLPKEVLHEVLDARFLSVAREWLFAGPRGEELRFVVCTTNGFRVASVPINGPWGDRRDDGVPGADRVP